MSRIVKRVNPEVVAKTAARCRRRGLVIPTFKQLRDPRLVPDAIRARLKGLGSRKSTRRTCSALPGRTILATGLYGGVNCFEIPAAITGVRARIIGLIGKCFPTGAHKVGAAFGCLLPRLVSGEFDPEMHKAAWPSTGITAGGGALIARCSIARRSPSCPRHVGRTIRLAAANRRRDHRHPGLRIQCQRNLR